MLRRAAQGASPRLLAAAFGCESTVAANNGVLTAAAAAAAASTSTQGFAGHHSVKSALPFGARNFSSSPAAADAGTSASDATSFATALADASPNSLSIAAELGEKAAIAQAMEGCWIPTQGMIEALTQLHSLSGMPWYVTIPVATLIVRGVTLPLMASQVTNAYKMAQAKPELDRLIAEMKQKGGESPDEKTAQEYQEKVGAVWAKYDASPFAAFRPLLINAPIFISFFFALRQLCEAKLPSLTTEGLAWFTDLTVADPNMILPVLTPLTMLLTVELNAMDGMAAGSPQSMMMKWFMRGVSVLMLPMMFQMPTSVLLYWNTTNMFSLGWSQASKLESVRKSLGMPSMAEMAAVAGKEPPVDYMQKAREAYANITGQKAEDTDPASTKISQTDFVGKPAKSRALKSRRRKKHK